MGCDIYCFVVVVMWIVRGEGVIKLEVVFGSDGICGIREGGCVFVGCNNKVWVIIVVMNYVFRCDDFVFNNVIC